MIKQKTEKGISFVLDNIHDGIKAFAVIWSHVPDGTEFFKAVFFYHSQSSVYKTEPLSIGFTVYRMSRVLFGQKT